MACFFVLLDKDGEIIWGQENISVSERNMLIGDFHKHVGSVRYIQEAVDFATDLDVGTKVILMTMED